MEAHGARIREKLGVANAAELIFLCRARWGETQGVS
jgi:hypothetical protein